MKQKLRILYLEDNLTDVELVQHTMRKSGMDVELQIAQDGVEYLTAIGEIRFDLILSDSSVLGFDGVSAFAVAREMQPGTPFIFLSGSATREQAAQKQQATGAAGCLSKDDLQHLADTIVQTLTNKRATRPLGILGPANEP